HWFDSHTHLQFVGFKEDLPEILARARQAGLIGIVNVGTQKDTSAAAVALAQENNDLYAAVGLHPIHTDKTFHDVDELGIDASAGSGFNSRGEIFDFDLYKKLAANPKTVAIGECGLDYYHLPKENREEAIRKQKAAFIAQISLSKAVNKPLMIHCRDAWSDLLAILEEQKDNLLPNAGGIAHFFSGDLAIAKELLAKDFYFTFGGAITFPPKADQPRAGGTNYEEVLKYIPSDRILLETDAPYVAPLPYRGQRNEPAYIEKTAEKMAVVKNVSLEELSFIILENSKRIFRLQ
ncbi:MAG: TatD family hydrolase, partial [bacterium]|nr:TatD family hydrolase [bacterium]